MNMEGSYMLLLDCTEPGLDTLVGIVKGALQLIQILIPIGLIIYGTIDLGKAVISSDEKKIQEGQKTLMKRALTAALVFFVAAIVTFLMGFVGNEAWKSCWKDAKPCDRINSTTGDCDCHVWDNAAGKCIEK
jgi:hypothetical protein